MCLSVLRVTGGVASGGQTGQLPP